MTDRYNNAKAKENINILIMLCCKTIQMYFLFLFIRTAGPLGKDWTQLVYFLIKGNSERHLTRPSYSKEVETIRS